MVLLFVMFVYTSIVVSVDMVTHDITREYKGIITIMACIS
jgi:hypothetical protein